MSTNQYITHEDINKLRKYVEIMSRLVFFQDQISVRLSKSVNQYPGLNDRNNK